MATHTPHLIVANGITSLFCSSLVSFVLFCLVLFIYNLIYLIYLICFYHYYYLTARDMYKRQVEMIRELIRVGNSFGAQLVQTNEGPKFSYTTLESTKEVPSSPFIFFVLF